MRDRLMELLKKGQTEWLEKEYNHETDKELAEYVADYLLAEGVIVPPCKVGDTIYCIWQYSDFHKQDRPVIRESKVGSFILDDGEAKVIPENYVTMANMWYRLLSVHYTREEAEKALKERREE